MINAVMAAAETTRTRRSNIPNTLSELRALCDSDTGTGTLSGLRKRGVVNSPSQRGDPSGAPRMALSSVQSASSVTRATSCAASVVRSAARTMFSLAARLFSVAIRRLRTIRNRSEAHDLEDAVCVGSRVDFGASGEGAGGEGLLMWIHSCSTPSTPISEVGASRLDWTNLAQ